MIPSMTINGVDVRAEFGLYVRSRSIQLPEPKTILVEVPGADSAVDLSTALTDGDLKFHDREVTVVLSKLRGYNAGRDALANLVHGRKIRFSFSDGPEHFYVGDATLAEWGYDAAGIGSYTLLVRAEPYRYLAETTRIEFNATPGSILAIPNRRMRTFPVITAEAATEISVAGKKWDLAPGEPSALRELVLREGETRVRFSTESKVVIEYQEGEL